MRLARALQTAVLTALFVLIAQAVPAYAANRPNIVVIETDDQPIIELAAKIRDWQNRETYAMPMTQRMLVDHGIQFTDYLTSFPLCAPSRATLLSGQYAHNHGVIRIGGPRGGWNSYQANPIMHENLPVWLQRAGYTTSHLGKFMNFYGGPDTPEPEVPPGWDNWYTDATDNSTREFYGYTLNVNGRIVGPIGYRNYGWASGVDPAGCPFDAAGPCRYHEDAISLRAQNIIANSGKKPFYIQLDYHTPHGDFNPPIGPEPPPRYYDSALHTRLPRGPAFNERNISDKPRFMREGAPKMKRREIIQTETEYQKSLEALRAVDDGVKWIVNALRRKGKLDDTYIFFTSDNGFFLGEHRLSRGKLLPYEPAVHVPMVVRGPGIKPGTKSDELVANIDIAPTIAKLARAKSKMRGTFMDGRPMNRFWKKPGQLSRRPILLEAYQAQTQLIPGDLIVDRAARKAGVSAKATVENYIGLRLGPYKYVDYEVGDRELYDLGRDPDELHNRIDDPRYRKVRRYMDRNLQKLRGCVARECRQAVGAWPTPSR